jgi:hypothetical protein
MGMGEGTLQLLELLNGQVCFVKGLKKNFMARGD